VFYIAFVCLTLLTLSARWYISGHAPWSNAYEAIVYGLATMFFGLAFDIKSKLTSAAFVTSMILSAAYMNWIDPEIANLQPVLNSLLMIHVAVIVGVTVHCIRNDLRFCFVVVDLFTNEKHKVGSEYPRNYYQ
jgi:ABC-type transport system involved in cytochrome c biogenesis permease subunit